MLKTIQTRILSLAKNVLYARRNGNIKREQRSYEALQSYLDKQDIDIGAGEAVEQARKYLSKTDVAAIMNGLTGRTYQQERG